MPYIFLLVTFKIEVSMPQWHLKFSFLSLKHFALNLNTNRPYICILGIRQELAFKYGHSCGKISLIEKRYMWLAYEKTPCISLTCKLVPVQYGFTNKNLIHQFKVLTCAIFLFSVSTLLYFKIIFIERVILSKLNFK